MSKVSNTQRLRLYLIRHGEVEGASGGRLFGQTDVPLSGRGLEQARQLAEKLAPARLAAVYSSDLRRARLTAEIIAGRNRVRVWSNSAWREIDMGEWEGRTPASLHAEMPGRVAQLYTDPASFEYPEGESFTGFTGRVQGALGQLVETHRSRGEVALVAHAGVCRAVVGGVLEVPMRNWLRLGQDYGCLSVIDWYGANPVLRILNLSFE
jgi:alpha-ribazole phosphatase